jgi:unsaturated chondroitin disaccharide hydrolase
MNESKAFRFNLEPENQKYLDILDYSMNILADGSNLQMEHLFDGGDSGKIQPMNNRTGRYSLGTNYAPGDGGLLIGRLWLLFLHSGKTQFKEWALHLVNQIEQDLLNESLFNDATTLDVYYGLNQTAKITDFEKWESLFSQVSSTISNKFWNETAQCFYSENYEEKQLSMDLTGGMLPLHSENISEKSRERLIAHFDTILDLNMIRTDGSVRQCAIFDSFNNFSHYSTNHGYEVFDSVAKTHASTMLNFISVYEITGQQRFLNQTITLANYWCDSIPEDWVPRYDFIDPEPNTKPKDSCAASIAVVAMIRLCKIRPELNAHYRLVIEETLKILSKKYLAEGGILLHSSWGDQRWHSALKFEPVPSNLVFPQEEILPFGNYFFVEAIFRELNPTKSI